MKIAVVGSGIAGITAAYLLSQKHEVELYERNGYLGGHTNTRILEGGADAGTPVDTGFIVCNPTNYPNFYKLLSRLGVELIDSDMSFGYLNEANGFCYVGPALKEFIRIPENFISPRFIKFIWEQRSFNRQMLRDLKQGKLNEIALGEYLRKIGVSTFFLENYVTPMVASIWSSPDIDAHNFPAATFAVFFKNHGMFELNKLPRWQTVRGGSHAYIHAFKKIFNGKIHLNATIASITRDNAGIVINHQDNVRFDRVVIATHADQALKLLGDPTKEESSLLGQWRYNKNRTVLHTDSSVLGSNRRLWAAWNYRRTDADSADSPLSITYYMNCLQRLRTMRDYFVTLNPRKELSASDVIYEIEYEHPIYTPQAVTAQSAIKRLNGTLNTFYCGAYLGYGFHEDGVNSALAVSSHFGVTL